MRRSFVFGVALACSIACSHSIPEPVRVSDETGAARTAKANPDNVDPNLDPPFGPYDVQTVFYISKSNDKDRVDYGIRLDEWCAPVGEEAMFPYWRELENAPPVRSHELKFYQYAAYGFSERRVIARGRTGGRFLVQIKNVDRPILVVTKQGKDGRCVATPYTTILDVEGARLDHIFAKVAGLMSVDYIDVHGRAPSGKALVERLRP